MIWMEAHQSMYKPVTVMLGPPGVRVIVVGPSTRHDAVSPRLAVAPELSNRKSDTLQVSPDADRIPSLILTTIFPLEANLDALRMPSILDEASAVLTAG